MSMDSVSNSASQHSHWRAAWDSVDDDFAAALRRVELDDCISWAGLTRGIEPTRLRTELEDFLLATGLLQGLTPLQIA